MASRWFYLGTPLSTTNKIDHHIYNLTEILLNVALYTKPNQIYIY